MNTGFAELFEVSDRFNPLSTIKPESQKIGRPVIKPVMAIADEAFFFPVFERIYPAILIVAPVTSRVTPITVPKMIINPIDPIVSPKPFFKAGTIWGRGSTTSAISKETKNRERNELNLNQEVNTMIRIIPPAIRRRPCSRLIALFLLNILIILNNHRRGGPCGRPFLIGCKNKKPGESPRLAQQPNPILQLKGNLLTHVQIEYL
jgi:hypothetical protein